MNFFSPEIWETGKNVLRDNFLEFMEDLTQSWSCLSLTDREGPGCSLTNGDRFMDYSIIEKFLTKRALNMDVIARTFNPLWRSCNGFKI